MSDIIETGEVTEYPIERHVATHIVNEVGYGGEISHAELNSLLECAEPQGRLTAADYQSYTFGRLAKIEGLKRILLNDHFMLLDNVRGNGYRVIKPKEQTKHVLKDFRELSNKLSNRSISQLSCLCTDDLSDFELQENADALGTVASISTMLKRQLAMTGVTLKKIEGGK